MPDLLAQRRELLLAPLLAALPLALSDTARAEPLNPAQTMITMPEQIAWKARSHWPENSAATVTLAGNLNQPGLYYMLMKWYPGYMSAPHTYVTDRLCVVVSGTWWVNSGADFDSAHCVAAPAGTFVRRVAHTPHYDGVVADGTEPAVIAICGIGPVGRRYIDPGKPGWRKV
ncbi:MAG: hypothetical protein QOH05_4768 [Acetobacteraceae bacterium]|jgi:hypothetical protein|nr:hypothetical protein [Acetobacteraceae bacterium]